MDWNLFYRHSILPIVELDGERFYLTIPFIEMWDRFLAAVAEGRIRDEYTEHIHTSTLCFGPDITSSGWTIEYLRKLPGSCYPVDMGCFKYTVGDGGYLDDYPASPVRGMKERLIGFRPVLIPITKEGVIDETFSESNPDGVILEGGYIKLKGSLPFLGNVLPSLEPPTIEPDTKGFRLGVKNDIPDNSSLYDSMEGPLKWWSFEGVLISTSVVLLTTFRTLFEMGPVPVLRREYAKYLPKEKSKNETGCAKFVEI